MSGSRLEASREQAVFPASPELALEGYSEPAARASPNRNGFDVFARLTDEPDAEQRQQRRIVERTENRNIAEEVDGRNHKQRERSRNQF